MNDKYTVINKNEPHGQSIAENGIPCTAILCATQLNRLSQNNEKLEARLKLLLDFTQQINRSVMVENHILTEKSHEINNLLNDLYEAIDENYTERLENDDELAIIRAEAQLNLITSIIDEIERIELRK